MTDPIGREALLNAIADPWEVSCQRCGAAKYTRCPDVIDGTDAHMDRRADAVLALEGAHLHALLKGLPLPLRALAESWREAEHGDMGR